MLEFSYRYVKQLACTYVWAFFMICASEYPGSYLSDGGYHRTSEYSVN